MEKSIDVSIILAVYNEEQSVTQELNIIKDSMDNSGYSYEIIAVDDASTDKTNELLRSVSGITVITHKRNKGSGGSRKTGTLAANGEIVVWSDVDLSYPNEEIPALIKKLKTGDFRQVIGARKSEKGTLKFLRAPAKFVLRKLASFLAKTDIPDLNSGLRAFYKTDALKFISLIPNGFSCVSTITLSFLCNDLEVGYMPINYKKRTGKSKFHPIKDSYSYLLQIVRMITYFEPLRIFVPLSILIFVFTLFKHIFNLLIFKNTQETDIVGYFAAIIIFVVGLLADLTVAYSKSSIKQDGN